MNKKNCLRFHLYKKYKKLPDCLEILLKAETNIERMMCPLSLSSFFLSFFLSFISVSQSLVSIVYKSVLKSYRPDQGNDL